MREVANKQLARASSDLSAEKVESDKLDFSEMAKKQFELILRVVCFDNINFKYDNYDSVYAGIMYETRIGKLVFSPELVTWVAGCLNSKEGVVRKVARDEDIERFDAVIEEFLIELYCATDIGKPRPEECLGSLKMLDKCNNCVRGYLNNNKELDFVWQLSALRSNLEDAIEMLERVVRDQNAAVSGELEKIIKQLKGIKNEA